MLLKLLTSNRAELLKRCREKVALRFAPDEVPAVVEHGVPLFLDQLARILGHERLTSVRPVADGDDEAAGKETFVSLLGAERARRQADALVEQAIAHLRGFGEEAELLRALARFAVERDH